VVGAQQSPQFLLGAVRGLGSQHDAVTFELGLERAERVLDLPAGVVELGQFRGGSSLDLRKVATLDRRSSALRQRERPDRGNDRVTKAIKHVASGFRNEENYERLIMLQNAAHRAA